MSEVVLFGVHAFRQHGRFRRPADAYPCWNDEQPDAVIAEINALAVLEVR